MNDFISEVIIRFENNELLEPDVIREASNFADIKFLFKSRNLTLWQHLLGILRTDSQIKMACEIVNIANHLTKKDLELEQQLLSKIDPSDLIKFIIEYFPDRWRYGKIVNLSMLDRMIIFGDSTTASLAIDFFVKNPEYSLTLISDKHLITTIAKCFIYNKTTVSTLKSFGLFQHHIRRLLLLSGDGNPFYDTVKNGREFVFVNLLHLKSILKIMNFNHDEIYSIINGDNGNNSHRLIQCGSLFSHNSEFVHAVSFAASVMAAKQTPLTKMGIANILANGAYYNNRFGFLIPFVYGIGRSNTEQELSVFYETDVKFVALFDSYKTSQDYIDKTLSMLHDLCPWFCETVRNVSLISFLIESESAVNEIIKIYGERIHMPALGYADEKEAFHNIDRIFGYNNNLLISIFSDVYINLYPGLSNNVAIKKMILDSIAGQLGDSGNLLKVAYDLISKLPINKIIKLCEKAVEHEYIGEELGLSIVRELSSIDIDEIYCNFISKSENGLVFFGTEYSMPDSSDGKSRIRLPLNDDILEFGTIKELPSRIKELESCISKIAKPSFTREEIAMAVCSFASVHKITNENCIEFDFLPYNKENLPGLGVFSRTLRKLKAFIATANQLDDAYEMKPPSR